MNTLEYFRNNEGNDAQNDWEEGTCGTINKNQLCQFGIDLPKEFLKITGDSVILVNDYYGLNNIYCLYRLYIDDDRKVVQLPSADLYNFDGDDGESKVVIHFTDTDEFLRRVENALDKAVENNEIEYGIYGDINYTSAWVNADGPGFRCAFHKDPSYEYQAEWRLCILRNALDGKAFSFKIGDLSDITEVISIEQFLENTESLYNGYTAEIIDAEANKTLRFFGNIDAASHLMYSYSKAAGNQPTRSDIAEADWHYAQYLKLSGKRLDIDAYLEKRMTENPDFDHLELLYKHRISIGEWVRATDAFMFFINNHPNVIKENPERFFFQLHQILMQNGEPEDAAKLLLIAKNDYGLNDETANIIECDVLFALGLYDKVIPVFLKLKEHCDDPVLDYDLAVCNLHILKFEEADRYLSSYENYFSHSTHTAERVVHLRKLIDCFKNESPLELEYKKHIFSDLEWDEKIEETICGKSAWNIYLGIDFMYMLEKFNRWDVVDASKSIVCLPLTIARVIELYINTGDIYFYNIIIKCSKLPQLKMESAELNEYIAVGCANPELPPHIKMERAWIWKAQLESRTENEK